MGEALQGAVNVTGQGDVASSCSVVPFQMEATILAAVAVNFAFVMGPKNGKKVIDVGLMHEFDAEVVDDEGKNNRSGFVVPKAGSKGHGFITSRGKQGDKEIIGEATGLREAVHALGDFD